MEHFDIGIDPNLRPQQVFHMDLMRKETNLIKTFLSNSLHKNITVLYRLNTNVLFEIIYYKQEDLQGNGLHFPEESGIIKN